MTYVLHAKSQHSSLFAYPTKPTYITQISLWSDHIETARFLHLISSDFDDSKFCVFFLTGSCIIRQNNNITLRNSSYSKLSNVGWVYDRSRLGKRYNLNTIKSNLLLNPSISLLDHETWRFLRVLWNELFVNSVENLSHYCRIIALFAHYRNWKRNHEQWFANGLYANYIKVSGIFLLNQFTSIPVKPVLSLKRISLIFVPFL